VNLNELRRARGWTLEDVAERVGVTKSAIHDIETGRREPSLKLYCKLMSLFDYSVPRLVAKPGAAHSNQNNYSTLRRKGSVSQIETRQQ
jgi:transcriptional regulator with XRE-family HTH domain